MARVRPSGPFFSNSNSFTPPHPAPPWTSRSWHETDEWGENSPLIHPFSWLWQCASHTPSHPNLAAPIWAGNGQMRGAIFPCSFLALLRVACSLYATQLQHLQADWGVKTTNEGEVLPRLSLIFLARLLALLPLERHGIVLTRLVIRLPHLCHQLLDSAGLLQQRSKSSFGRKRRANVTLTATTTIDKRQPSSITARSHQMPPKHGTKTGCKSAPAISKDEVQISHKHIGSIGDETAPKRTHRSQ